MQVIDLFSYIPIRMGQKQNSQLSEVLAGNGMAMRLVGNEQGFNRKSAVCSESSQVNTDNRYVGLLQSAYPMKSGTDCAGD